MIETIPMGQNPFAVLTLIAAPALLTNASSVLALSTINRMLRTRERMRELFAQSESPTPRSDSERARLLQQVNRVERQAILLLRALRSIYVALGAFVGATLVTLVGAGLATVPGVSWFQVFAGVGLSFGFLGVGGLVVGSVSLVQATQLSLLNIRDEASWIRERQTARSAAKPGNPSASPGH